MKKNLVIDLLAHFGDTVAVHKLRSPAQGVTIRHAERSYYQNERDEAMLQEFDGRSGYLYSIELRLQDSLDIPIRAEEPDLHILYLMSGTQPIQLLDSDRNILCELTPERSRYIYLPKGDYVLRIPTGCTNLFGLYFDGGIFRDDNDKEFPFLEPVLNHYRCRQENALASIDFWIGPRTKSAILYLCQNLRRGVLSNEDFISRNLFRLIQLSKKKIALLPSYNVQTSYIDAIRERIVHELEDGNGIPSLELIAADIRISPDHLNRLHKQIHGKSIRDYAKSVLVEQAIHMLQSGMTATEVGIHFNYSNVFAFGRIIKSKTGKTPSQWMTEKKG